MGNVIEFIKYHLRMTKFSLPSSIRIIDIVQILLIAIFVYYLMVWIKNTRAYTLLKGVLIVSVFLIIAAILRMDTILWICQQLSVVAITGVLVIFQPELRRALEHIGRTKIGTRTFSVAKEGESLLQQERKCINAVVEAAASFQKSKTGALIVFERQTKLGEIVDTGTIVNADPSAQIIGNIFFNKAPLHDGAMIIRNGMIYAAGCILPLTKNDSLSVDLGTRHRAAVGMSENSDAVILVVSEETGTISLAINGVITRNYTRETLKGALENEILPDVAEDGDRRPIFSSFRRVKKDEKK